MIASYDSPRIASPGGGRASGGHLIEVRRKETNKRSRAPDGIDVQIDLNRQLGLQCFRKASSESTQGRASRWWFKV